MTSQSVAASARPNTAIHLTCPLEFPEVQRVLRSSSSLQAGDGSVSLSPTQTLPTARQEVLALEYVVSIATCLDMYNGLKCFEN